MCTLLNDSVNIEVLRNKTSRFLSQFFLSIDLDVDWVIVEHSYQFTFFSSFLFFFSKSVKQDLTDAFILLDFEEVVMTTALEH